eukprot:5868689-Alexandrium_andersonii.AAC.1
MDPACPPTGVLDLLSQYMEQGGVGPFGALGPAATPVLRLRGLPSLPAWRTSCPSCASSGPRRTTRRP